MKSWGLQRVGLLLCHVRGKPPPGHERRGADTGRIEYQRGDDGPSAAFDVAMLMEGEAVQSTFNAQNSQTVWASVGHSEFDLPGTSVGATRQTR